MDISKINLEKSGINSVVSKFESDILNVLWEKKKASSKSVFRALGNKKDIASSTVSVYLDRLHSKGMVGRQVEPGKGGLHYLYSPKVSKSELEHGVVDSFVSFLKNNFGESSTAYLRKKIK